MHFSKSLFIAMGVAALLGTLVGTASAARLSSSSQTLRTAFTRVDFNGVFGQFICAVTLEGSLHSRTITKTAGSLVGYITTANLGACAEGSATILRETLPWHVQYSSFTGTLPNITTLRINVSGYSLRIRETLATCLARSEAAHPVVITFSRNTATGELTGAEISGTIPTSCGFEGSFDSDSVTPTVVGAATRITVTLI